MDWQNINSGFSMAVVQSGNSILDAMRDLCTQLKNVVVPLNESVVWDHVRVELWSDSGRFIVFPAQGKVNSRIEKAGCQIVFHDLLDQYESIADSELSDDEFARELTSLERIWIEEFLTAARAAGLGDRRFVFWDGGGEKCLLDVSLEQ